MRPLPKIVAALALAGSVPMSGLGIASATDRLPTLEKCKRQSKKFGKRAFIKRYHAKSYALALRNCVKNKGRPINRIGKIELTLPFSFADRPDGVIPMGETVYHPKPATPNGHPGIDYQWQRGQKPMILTSAAGVIKFMTQDADSFGTFSVVVGTGSFLIGYRELDFVNPALRVGTKLETGAFIGYPWSPTFNGSNDPNYRMVHWDFGYDQGTQYQDMLCPMTYFEEASRTLTESVYASSTWEHKSAFPYVCSGDFFGKDR